MNAPTADRPGRAESPPGETSLLRWVWRTYVRNALVPLLVAVYLTSHAWSLRKNVAALTEVLRRQTTAALSAPTGRTRDQQRLWLQPTGALTT